MLERMGESNFFNEETKKWEPKSIAQRIEENLPFAQPRELADDEYIKNGFYYCNKCNTPRQSSIVLENGMTIKVYHLCKCQIEENDRQEKEAKEKERIRKLEEYRMSVMGREAGKLKFELDDGKTPELTDKFKNYVYRFEEVRGKGLLLYGSFGTGKSFYAKCIANAMIDKGYKVLFTSTAELLAKAGEFCNIADEVYGKDLIVIDDFGTERKTSFADENIYNFINTIYNQRISLIITTNLTPTILFESKELSEQRIMSRIRGITRAVKIDLINRRNTEYEQSKKAIDSIFKD